MFPITEVLEEFETLEDFFFTCRGIRGLAGGFGLRVGTRPDVEDAAGKFWDAERGGVGAFCGLSWPVSDREGMVWGVTGACCGICDDAPD